MIPLRDSTRSRRFPIVTVVLIVLNILIFLYQYLQNDTESVYFLLRFSFIPAILTEQLQEHSLLGLIYPPFLTAVFLHGSWFHVLFNMLYLWIFGDNIEDRLGHFRFIIFYLLCGVLANGAHYLIDVNSQIPLVGASGAIAGVLGAYIITYPKAKITSVIFLVFFYTIRQVPALVFLLFWFAINLYQGLTTSGAGGGTAYWAHIGGFVFGVFLMLLLQKRTSRKLSNL